MIASIIYLMAIVAANLTLLHFGPVASIYNAFLLIGLDLALRDKLHDEWAGNQLWLRMGALILTGSMITIVLNIDALTIAIASAVAFAVSASGDGLIYHLLKNRTYLLRSNSSNVVGAALDSLIFPTLAFGTLMPEIVLGQFLAKTLGAGLWSILLLRLRNSMSYP